MTNVYNRKLLTDFDVSDIESLLDGAVVWVSLQRNSINSEIRNAIENRLGLRKSLLAAVALDLDVVNPNYRYSWGQCSELLPILLQSTSSGVSVENAFSAKIQRRLASSVPPRPIVKTSIEDACAHLSMLSQHGVEIVRVYDCRGGNNTLVRSDRE